MPDRTVNILINYKVNTAEVQRAQHASQEAQKATDKLRGSTKDAGDAFKKAGEEGSKSFMNLGAAVKGVAIALLAQQFLEFAKKVIAVRGEFQKFEAVLTNTLGSKSAALIALGRINEFAKTTPFGVSELTDAFIKLANRGVEPTIKQMRAIGDLSATLGKSFKDVVEAILDINNPERWKEIGVKAETIGSKVRLSFRDTSVEVDRTVKGVTDAVVALGQLNGVAGSTEAISKTLAGQTNNLADAWQQVFNTLGQSNQGILYDTISLLSKAIEKANELLKGSEQRFTELTSKTLSAEIDSFQALVTTFGDIDKASAEFSKKTDERLKEIATRQRELMDVPKFQGGVEAQQARDNELADLRDLYDVYSLQLPKAIEETIKKLKDKEKAEQDANSKEAAVALEKELAAESMAIGKQVTMYLTDLSDQELLEMTDNLKAKIEQRKRGADAEEEIAKNSAAHVKYYKDLEVKKTQEAEDEKLRIEEDAAQRRIKLEAQAAEQRRQIQDSLVDFFSNSLSMILTAKGDSGQKELEDLSDKYQDEIKMAGDNERAKAELEIKFDREKERLEKESGERKKKAALVQIAIDTATNAVKLFAETVPPGILSAIAVAFGLVQAGVVSRQKFKDGVLSLQGPGTETSDSIPAMLSRGESVMTAEETRKNFGLLSMMKENKIDDRIMRGIDFSGGRTFSDSRIVEKLASVESQLKRLKQPDIIAQAGAIYTVHTDEQGNKKKIRSRSI